MFIVHLDGERAPVFDKQSQCINVRVGPRPRVLHSIGAAAVVHGHFGDRVKALPVESARRCYKIDRVVDRAPRL